MFNHLTKSLTSSINFLSTFQQLSSFANIVKKFGKTDFPLTLTS